MEKNKEKPISSYPDENANWYWEDEWVESNIICPNCKIFRMWQAGWYDGTPEDGGACIGTQYKCGDCGHYETY